MQSYIIMLVVIVAMMFFMQRSQKKQQNKRQEVLDNMKSGNEVVTIGGLHGIISEIDEVNKTVTLDCEGIFLEFDRASIRTVKPSSVETTVAQNDADQKEEASEAADDSAENTDGASDSDEEKNND